MPNGIEDQNPASPSPPREESRSVLIRMTYGAIVGGGIGTMIGALDFTIAGGFMLAGRYFGSPGSESVLAACVGAIGGAILGWIARGEGADLGGIGYLIGLVSGVVPGGLAIGRNLAAARAAGRLQGGVPTTSTLGPWSELPTTALLLIFGGLAGWLLGSIAEWVTDRHFPPH